MEAELYISILNNNQSARRLFAYAARLVEKFADQCQVLFNMTSSSCLDERCVDSEKNPDLIDPADGLEGGNITELYVGNVTYTCGSTLTLEDIYLIYTPSGTQRCADIGCENGGTKWGIIRPVFRLRMYHP